MAIVYRTSGVWGTGKGSRLTSAEVDGNFKTLADAIAALGSSEDPISSITMANNALTITTQSGAQFGPFSLPKATFRPRGEWSPSTAYALYDTVEVPGDGLYLVVLGHTSDATFDANKLSSGSLCYSKIMDQAFWRGPDVIGVYANLTDYDSRGSGFSYLSTDGDGGTTTSVGVIFFKQSSTAGDWLMCPWQGGGGSTPYIEPTTLQFVGWKPGTYANSELIGRTLYASQCYLNQGLGGAVATLETAPSADTVFSIMANGSAYGTISFLAGETTGTVTSGSTTVIGVGGTIAIRGPATADATAAGLAWNIPTTYSAQPIVG